MRDLTLHQWRIKVPSWLMGSREEGRKSAISLSTQVGHPETADVCDVPHVSPAPKGSCQAMTKVHLLLISLGAMDLSWSKELSFAGKESQF